MKSPEKTGGRASPNLRNSGVSVGSELHRSGRVYESGNFDNLTLPGSLIRCFPTTCGDLPLGSGRLPAVGLYLPQLDAGADLIESDFPLHRIDQIFPGDLGLVVSRGGYALWLGRGLVWALFPRGFGLVSWQNFVSAADPSKGLEQFTSRGI